MEPQQYIRLADGTFQAVSRQQIVPVQSSAQPAAFQQSVGAQARVQAQGMHVPPGATIVGQGSNGGPINMQQISQHSNDTYEGMPQQGQASMQPQARPLQGNTGPLAQPPMQMAQPSPPPSQPQGGPMSRSAGPVPPQLQPPRGEGPPSAVGPSAAAQETLYVDDIPLDMSKRELSHIFRPFGGYKVWHCDLVS